MATITDLLSTVSSRSPVTTSDPANLRKADLIQIDRAATKVMYGATKVEFPKGTAIPVLPSLFLRHEVENYYAIHSPSFSAATISGCKAIWLNTISKECRPSNIARDDWLLWAWLKWAQPRLFKGILLTDKTLPDISGAVSSTRSRLISASDQWDGLRFVLCGCATAFVEGDASSGNPKTHPIDAMTTGDFFGDDAIDFGAWISDGSISGQNHGVGVIAGSPMRNDSILEGPVAVLHLNADVLSKIGQVVPAFPRTLYDYWRARNQAWRVADGAAAGAESRRLISRLAGLILLETARSENTAVSVELSLPADRTEAVARLKSPGGWKKIEALSIDGLTMRHRSGRYLLTINGPAIQQLIDVAWDVHHDEKMRIKGSGRHSRTLR